MLAIYEDCKQGDVIEAGAADGTCINVTIFWSYLDKETNYDL